MSEGELLKSIDLKLGQFIALTKALNKEKLTSIRQKISEDKEQANILEICRERTSFSDILNKVKTLTGASEGTAKRRLAELRENGALVTVREGREVYYLSSGLFD